MIRTGCQLQHLPAQEPLSFAGLKDACEDAEVPLTLQRRQRKRATCKGVVFRDA